MTQKQRMRKRRRRRKMILRVIGITLIFIILIFFGVFIYIKTSENIRITVKPVKESILQEEEVPNVKWEARIDKKWHQKLLLDLKGFYTVGDLIEDLKKGEYLSSETAADVNIEGEYPVEVTMDNSYKMMKNIFGWKIDIEVEDGTLEVKNKVGEWDGTRFKKWDGTYLTNEFLTYKTKVYYFDENGEMVTGMKQIGDQIYFFNEDGARGHGWQDIDGSSYYFNEEGVMQTGWQEIAGNTYYLGADGKKVTGVQWVGMMKCRFDENGVLTSKEHSVNPDKPMIALTFDDGPGPETDRLLDVLEENDAHATFFMTGGNASARPETVQRMLALGCELGNHTWNHPQLTKLDVSGIQNEVGSTNSAIASACGSPATVLRPPYGDYNSSVLSAAGMPAILWSVDTLDWKTKSKVQTVESIMSAKDGDIVLMHDIHTWSIDAAIEAIPKLIEAGYQLVTVSEMAAVRNGGLRAGQNYSQFYP